MSDKLKYNTNIHHRKSTRKKGYDYSKVGLYFITICCQNKRHRFGNITAGAGFTPARNNAAVQMVLNEYGTVAHDEWIKLSERFPHIQLDAFQIMPNHMHGIISLNNLPVLSNGVLAGAGTPAEINMDVLNDDIGDIDVNDGTIINDRATARVAPTVSDIIGAYKSLVANGCLDIYKLKNVTMGKLWQRNYHEHIIRDEQSYRRISAYIVNNPVKWTDDKFYTK